MCNLRSRCEEVVLQDPYEVMPEEDDSEAMANLKRYMEQKEFHKRKGRRSKPGPGYTRMLERQREERQRQLASLRPQQWQQQWPQQQEVPQPKQAPWHWRPPKAFEAMQPYRPAPGPPPAQPRPRLPLGPPPAHLWRGPRQSEEQIRWVQRRQQNIMLQQQQQQQQQRGPPAWTDGNHLHNIVMWGQQADARAARAHIQAGIP